MIRQEPAVDPTATLRWLESHVRPHLRPDVSNYAPGRLRAWLGIEPALHRAFRSQPGVDVGDDLWDGLQALLHFRFDYALVTWSGGGQGITAHRDAGYAASEAVGWNISGTCVFRYFDDETGTPTHVLTLQPGDVIRFDCKKRHAAEPSANRWAMNFWRARQ